MQKTAGILKKASGSAVFFACTGIFMFSIVTALVKLVAADHNVFLISFYRNFFALLPAAALLLMTRKLKPRTISQWPVHIMRSVFGFCSMLCLFQAFHMMPLAEATMIYYTGPICITLLAGLILKEQIRRSSLLAVILGFAGVFLIIRPEQTDFNVGVGFALAGTLFYAFAMISLRQLGKSEDPFMMSFIFALIATVLNAAFLPWVWEVPDAQNLLFLIAIGILAFIAQTLMNVAYIKSTASALSPLIYTSLIWNTMFGFALWGDVPTIAALLGLFIILFANILNKKKPRTDKYGLRNVP